MDFLTTDVTRLIFLNLSCIDIQSALSINKECSYVLNDVWFWRHKFHTDYGTSDDMSGSSWKKLYYMKYKQDIINILMKINMMRDELNNDVIFYMKQYIF